MKSDLKFSESAKLVLENAKSFAASINSDYVDARHIVVAMFTTHSGLAYRVMLKNGIKTEDVHKLAQPLLTESKRIGHYKPSGEFTGRTEQILENAGEDAKRLGVDEIGTEHILISIIRDKNPLFMEMLKEKQINQYSLCHELLQSYGLSGEECKKYVKEYIAPLKTNRSSTKTKAKQTMLEQFARNMTQEAIDGKLDPVVGRYEEIVRVMQILGRRTKNNACLVGEPGVGKTAIVEGIAQLIVKGQVPDDLRDKEIMSLDLAAMLAGTRYRGDFEERLKNTIDELKSQPNVILFIDELHTLIGAGGSEGTHDAANIFKPALSRGEIHMIGATTLEEYRKYIEKDAALERRFQPVTVDEPTPAETRDILVGLRSRFEDYHGVEISDEAIDAAVTYSVRYINDRFLPDKAIDLIDEACARIKLGKVPKDFSYKAEEETDLTIKRDIDEALKNSDMARVIRLRRKLKNYNQGENNTDERLMVSDDDVAAVVSVWTKIPVTKLTVSEQSKLLELDKNLHKRVVGQDEAVTAVARSIKRSRAGLRSPDRPIGAFLFLGPTGVGKTELSKALAEILFGDDKSLIRVDMSEYMEKHTVSKLIGSPPGYVGYEEGGQLSEIVRRNPYSVVLFDEVEKAHPDVYNILLQVLDDGIITDSQGRRVDFKNTIIIMTSNLGADKILDPKSIGFVTDNSDDKSHEEMKTRVMDAVKDQFKPEFINRLDDIIVFRSLSESEVLEIAGLMLKELKGRVAQNADIRLTYGAKLKKYIFEKGYDKKFGARPLRRAVQTYIEDPLAEKLLSGEIKKGDTVSISVSSKPEEGITFSVKS